MSKIPKQFWSYVAKLKVTWESQENEIIIIPINMADLLAGPGLVAGKWWY